MSDAFWNVMLRASAATLGVVSAGAGQAEQPATGPVAAPEAESPSAAGAVPGEITVTARRRAERLIDVPVSVSALNVESVERYATTTLNTLGTQLPQVRISQGNGTGISNFEIRGVGFLANDPGTQQMVTLNVDGMMISRGRGVVSAGLLDLQSVEVLKGPQALFFGKNSPAGVISLNSVSPGSDFTGFLRAGFDFLDKQRYVEAAVSVPLTPSLAVRVAGRVDDSRGYVRNVAVAGPNPFRPAEMMIPTSKWSPASQNYLGRLTIAYRPDGPFDVVLKAYGSNHKDAGIASTLEFVRCAPGQTNPTINGQVNGVGPLVAIADLTGDCIGNYRRSQTGVDVGTANLYRFGRDSSYTFIRSFIGSAVANYRLDDITLTSTTGYYWYHARYFENFNFSAPHINNGAQDEENKDFSQELRLTSSFDGPIDFTLGAFYEHEQRDFLGTPSISINPTDVSPAALAAGFPNGSRNSSEYFADNGSETLSAFGQLSWNILANLELAGGARYTRQKLDISATQLYSHPLRVGIFVPVGTVIAAEDTYTNVSPEVTLTWHPTTDVTLYGAYKEGFLSGGFANPGILSAGATPDTLRFRPATAQGGEIGFKALLADRRLSIDGTLYRYDYKDLQITSLNALTITYTTTNAASSRVYGAELQATYRVTPEFSLNAYSAYNHGRYRRFPNAQCAAGQTLAQGCTPITIGGRTLTVQDLSGKRLGTTPDFNGKIGFTYERALAADWRVGLTSDLLFNTKYNFSAGGGSTYRVTSVQGGQAYLNTSLRVFNEAFELALIGNNLTDRKAIIYSSDTPNATPGTVQGQLNRPREVIVQGTFRF